MKLFQSFMVLAKQTEIEKIGCEVYSKYRGAIHYFKKTDFAVEGLKDKSRELNSQ